MAWRLVLSYISYPEWPNLSKKNLNGIADLISVYYFLSLLKSLKNKSSFEVEFYQNRVINQSKENNAQKHPLKLDLKLAQLTSRLNKMN